MVLEFEESWVNQIPAVKSLRKVFMRHVRQSLSTKLVGIPAEGSFVKTIIANARSVPR